jgi:hypothetical protein
VVGFTVGLVPAAVVSAKRFASSGVGVCRTGLAGGSDARE